MGATRIRNAGTSAKGSSTVLDYHTNVVAEEIAVHSPYNLAAFLPIDLGF